MERIFFFTTKTKLKDINVTLDFNLDNAQNSVLNKDYTFPNGNVISLIADAISVQEMKQILEKYSNTTNIFYVFHQQTSKMTLEAIKIYCFDKGISLTSVQDIHQKGKSKFYHLVKDLSKPNAELTVVFFDELKKKFNYDEVLEKKLELLHKCLAFKDKPALDPMLKEKHEKHYSEFLASVKNLKTDGTNKDHIDALKELRRKLLGS